MRSGRRVVKEWLAPLCSCSGATTQTSSDRSRAICSRSLMPGASMPSSLEIRTRHVAKSMRPSAMRHDDLLPAHIGPQHLGDPDGAVVLLKVLDDRDQRAADRKGGAVEGVDRPGAL